MFGLSKNEKFARKFKKEGIQTTGEVSYIGDNPDDILFKTIFPEHIVKSCCVVKFKPPNGEEATIRFFSSKYDYHRWATKLQSNILNGKTDMPVRLFHNDEQSIF